MSQVEFQDESDMQGLRPTTILGVSDKPKMVKILMKTGMFKDDRAVESFLVIVSIIFFVIAGILFYLATRGPQIITPMYIEDLDPSEINNPDYMYLPNKQ